MKPDRRRAVFGTGPLKNQSAGINENADAGTRPRNAGRCSRTLGARIVYRAACSVFFLANQLTSPSASSALRFSNSRRNYEIRSRGRDVVARPIVGNSIARHAELGRQCVTVGR